jgi:hypothetical protein
MRGIIDPILGGILFITVLGLLITGIVAAG